MSITTRKATAKYRQIYSTVHDDIIAGRYLYGQQLPTDLELGETFSASRPTVAKAIGALQKQGLVERIIGSGTYVRYGRQDRRLLSFALLIPGLGETEIFESICGHMAHLAEEKKFNLIWSGSMADDAETRRRHIEQLAARYVQQKVDGVFFAPLELTSAKDTINEHIVSLFERARIPVVLMDRDVAAFPNRSHYDLVGVDNFRIGYIMTLHLIGQGCAHIAFVARPFSAPTVDMRICGYKEAIFRTGSAGPFDHTVDVHIGNVDDRTFAEALLNHPGRPGVICANDTTAARLMHTLGELGRPIPQDIAVVGIDDVNYAKYLHPPLTTYRQPCQAIAKTAINLMLTRIDDRDLPERTVYLDGKLIVRKSCLANTIHD